MKFKEYPFLSGYPLKGPITAVKETRLSRAIIVNYSWRCRSNAFEECISPYWTIVNYSWRYRNNAFEECISPYWTGSDVEYDIRWDLWEKLLSSKWKVK